MVYLLMLISTRTEEKPLNVLFAARKNQCHIGLLNAIRKNKNKFQVRKIFCLQNANIIYNYMHNIKVLTTYTVHIFFKRRLNNYEITITIINKTSEMLHFKLSGMNNICTLN